MNKLLDIPPTSRRTPPVPVGRPLRRRDPISRNTPQCFSPTDTGPTSGPSTSLLSLNSRSPSPCSLYSASPTQISIALSYGRMELTMASIPIPMPPSMQQRITDPTLLPRCGRSCTFLPSPLSKDLSAPAHIITSITNYNVVIVVLSMFIMLAKVCQYFEGLGPGSTVI